MIGINDLFHPGKNNEHNVKIFRLKLLQANQGLKRAILLPG
jgi:hypothetical protein